MTMSSAVNLEVAGGIRRVKHRLGITASRLNHPTVLRTTVLEPLKRQG